MDACSGRNASPGSTMMKEKDVLSCDHKVKLVLSERATSHAFALNSLSQQEMKERANYEKYCLHPLLFYLLSL